MAESLATALAPHVGRPEAMRLVGELRRAGISRRHDAARGRAVATRACRRCSTRLSSTARSTRRRISAARAAHRSRARSWRDLARERGCELIRGAVGDDGDRVSRRRARRTLQRSCSSTRSARTTGCGTRRSPRSSAIIAIVRYEACGHGVSDLPRGPRHDRELGERCHRAARSSRDRARRRLRMFARRRDRVVAGGESAGARRGGRVREHGREDWDQRELERADRGVTARRDGGGRRSGPRAILQRRVFVSVSPEPSASIGAMLRATDPRGYIAACEALRDADLRGMLERGSRADADRRGRGGRGDAALARRAAARRASSGAGWRSSRTRRTWRTSSGRRSSMRWCWTSCSRATTRITASPASTASASINASPHQRHQRKRDDD